jgi:hypothetical protein
MSLGYLHEKFSQAVLVLIGHGPLSTRLPTAMLPLLRLRREDFPDLSPEETELCDGFERFVETMTRIPGEEGSLRATVEAMPLSEQTAMAERIFSLYSQIARLLPPWQAP